MLLCCPFIGNAHAQVKQHWQHTANGTGSDCDSDGNVGSDTATIEQQKLYIPLLTRTLRSLTLSNTVSLSLLL